MTTTREKMPCDFCFVNVPVSMDSALMERSAARER